MILKVKKSKFLNQMMTRLNLKLMKNKMISHKMKKLPVLNQMMIKLMRNLLKINKFWLKKLHWLRDSKISRKKRKIERKHLLKKNKNEFQKRKRKSKRKLNKSLSMKKFKKTKWWLLNWRQMITRVQLPKLQSPGKNIPRKKENNLEISKNYWKQGRNKIQKMKEIRVKLEIMLMNQVQSMIKNNIIFIDVQYAYAEFLKEPNQKIAVILIAWIVS